ncbi:MAG TPA: hypothetical protein VGK93_09735 [Candidatus Eisenbacteria bacterium]|jgi:hypothetical protein
MSRPDPVASFAYARHGYPNVKLDPLEWDHVPLIYALGDVGWHGEILVQPR